MFEQERIKLKIKKKVSIGKYFTTYSGQTSEDNLFSYAISEGVNSPINLIENINDYFIKRNKNNNFIHHPSYIIHTGTTIVTKTELLSETQKDKLKANYINSIKNNFLSSGGSLSGTPFSYVTFEDIEDNDLYVNIFLNRTIDNLDTLNVYNVPINEIPKQESKTGVVFGKLEAVQKLVDINGKKIKIPLRNVPIAIFNPSEEFPTISSLDSDSNRIRLNIKENIFTGNYFNQESKQTDFSFLNDTSEIDKIPDKYKYSSTTNENGEFVIFNVPVGTQTLMYEVDLLKQGLTHDEIALNFFPYPVEDDPNVDSIPQYSFRQFPIEVVPAWGDFQTGYTQVNISTVLDLRKWSTYFISPISFKNKSIEELINSGINTKLTCEIRDMSKALDKNPVAVEVVQIPDVYNRNFEQVTEWNGEVQYKQKKSKVEFLTSNFNAFKIPANLYDSGGTNSNQTKGVWLNAYQFKMYYSDKENIYKATGFEREWLKVDKKLISIGRNNYDLNKNAEYGLLTSKPEGKIGKFPYEKPWSIDYPEPYKIPSVPKIINPNKKYDANGFPLSATEPKYLDGDKVGISPLFGSKSDGYGAQIIGGAHNPNQFAREVTAYSIYKYESLDQWDEQYSNGYQPLFPNEFSDFGTISKVEEGEKWQRLESGYAYWLKPEGWPRISNNSWGDTLLNSDYIKIAEGSAPAKLSPRSYVNNVDTSHRENIMIKMDNSVDYYRAGALDIYRILSPNKVIKPLPAPVEKFIKINFQDLIFESARKNAPFNWLEIGGGEGQTKQFHRVQTTSIIIRNQGAIKVSITIGGTSLEISPGTDGNFEGEIGPYSEILLPANNVFDGESNSYQRAKYEITLGAVISDTSNQDGPYESGKGSICYGGRISTYTNGLDSNGLLAKIENEIPTYYLVQVIPTIVLLNGQYPSQDENYLNAFLSGGVSMGINNAVADLYSKQLLTNSYELPLKLAINGFAFCVWRGHWPFANNSDGWAATYFPGGVPEWTPNPYTTLKEAPISTNTFHNYHQSYPFYDENGSYQYGFLN